MKKTQKNQNRSLKDTVARVFAKNTAAKLFIFMMGFSLSVYFIFYTLYGKGAFVDIFFIRGKDLFMDFFNSVRDASQGAEVYTVRHVIYPPMANLIYLVCSRFLPSVYNHSDWYHRTEWTKYPSAVLFIFLFTLTLLFLYFALVYKKSSGSEKVKFLFAFFAVFNVPVLYMVERGNMILFCLIAIFVYAFTYNSENKIYREIGLLSLAFAFSLKLYPVIFGYFLLTDKRFKEAIRCAIYGVLMLIIPSFFFGGPACFIQVFKNITSFSSGGKAANSISVLSGYSGIPQSVWTVAAYAWCFICVLCFALSPFVHKHRWKSYMVGITLILLVPSLTSLYTWAFLIIPITFLAARPKLSRREWFFFVVMSALFMFTVLRFNGYLTVNSFLLYPFTVVLSITVVADTVRASLQRLREIKAKKLEG